MWDPGMNITTDGWANYSVTYHWLHLSLQTGTSYITRLARCPLIWVGSDWRKGKWWFEDRRWVRLIWPGLELKYLMGDQTTAGVRPVETLNKLYNMEYRFASFITQNPLSSLHQPFSFAAIFLQTNLISGLEGLGNNSERRVCLRKFLSLFEPENIGEKWFWN